MSRGVGAVFRPLTGFSAAQIRFKIGTHLPAASPSMVPPPIRQTDLTTGLLVLYPKLLYYD
jgi:hypothetical protein